MNARADSLADVRARLALGARLAWIFGERSDGMTLHYVLGEGARLDEFAVAGDDAVPSLTGQCAAAGWYERELRDRFGVRFDGLHDGRPLARVAASEDLERITSPEVSTILYGPVRSGVGESARWVVETAGEDFVAVTPSMFYKHRGLEDRFAGVALELAPFVAEHVSGPTAASHAAAFCRATETALGLRVPPRARAARAILVELERIHQHLDSLAKLADDGALSVATAQTFAAKERVHRLLARATGSRFSRGVVCVGGTRFDVLAALQEACERDLDRLERHALGATAALMSTQSLLDRLIGAGRLGYETAVALGSVGPVGRGSGVSCDARLADGYLFRPLTGEETLERTGDAAARARVRTAEIRRSFQLVRNALDANPDGPYVAAAVPADGAAMARVESPQGELIYFVRLAGGAIARTAIRSASYANWPAFVPSLPGNIFTDFSFIEHSFGAIQSEVDR